MIHPDRYPFLALLLPVIAGIAASERVMPAPETCYIIVGTSLAALLLTFLVRRLRVWLLLPVAVILFTVALSRSRPPESSVIPGEIYLVEGARVTEVRGNRYVVRLRDYNLYLQPGDTCSFVVGDLLTFRARLFPPGRPVDLHEFSRDRYMRQLNVHFRAIPLAGVRRVGHRAGLYSRCQEARAFLGRKLEATVRDTTTRALLQALCLGDRSLVSTRVQTLFSESGTVHLLAVSGLHMGALYLLLNFFLGLARLHPRFRAACMLPLLWVFAGITGLSPPTVRAATDTVAAVKMVKAKFTACTGTPAIRAARSSIAM